MLYARFLRTHAEKRGVRRIEGKVIGIDQHPETGFVTSVTLVDGETLEAELFVDCSGFRGLLIEGALHAGYDDWSSLLPMDRAVAVPTESTEPPKPYTIATAKEAGWTWRIPLQHRTGNGHVYSSRYMEEEKATDILLSSVEGAPLADPRHLKFVTGIRRKFWDKNVVAIGLSGGFLEPLESTSIHMIQSAVAKLLALFPDRSWSPVDRDEYNRLLTVSFTHIRDFIILHYIATARNDTEFWRDRHNLELPETLVRKMALIEGSGRFFRYDDELFSVTSWLAVMQGQGRGPAGYTATADAISAQNLLASLQDMRMVIERTVASMPTHDAFLARLQQGNAA